MLKLKKNIMRKSFEKLWSDENVSLNSHVLPYRKRYFIGQNASRGWTCSLCSKSSKQEDIRKMESYKREFIEFMVDCNVLRFGEFTLKSGRKSPFFMNAGLYVTGAQLEKLGEYYAKAIHDNYGTDFDVLFGPAYKGIPLSVATTMAFHRLYGKEIRYCSNRKEIKDHGDAGILLGSPIKDGDRVVIIEDVTTSGKSIEETFPIIMEQGDVTIKGLMVSLNRMEKGKGEKSALKEIKEKYGFDANAIVSMDDVVEVLYNKPCNGKIVITDEIKKAIDAYYEQYGAKE
jgi:orotate phosphoribosyltransferase